MVDPAKPLNFYLETNKMETPSVSNSASDSPPLPSENFCWLAAALYLYCNRATRLVSTTRSSLERHSCVAEHMAAADLAVRQRVQKAQMRASFAANWTLGPEFSPAADSGPPTSAVISEVRAWPIYYFACFFYVSADSRTRCLHLFRLSCPIFNFLVIKKTESLKNGCLVL